MKRVLAIILAAIMLLSLAACGTEPTANEKVQKYIDKNGDELLSSLEASFATSSGMTCTSSIKVEGNGFVIHININELDNIPDDTKELLQSQYDSMGASFDSALASMQLELPELEYFTVYVCEVDGDVLAKIQVDG